MIGKYETNNNKEENMLKYVSRMSALLTSLIHHVEVRMRLLGALACTKFSSFVHRSREILEGVDTIVELAVFVFLLRGNGSGAVSLQPMHQTHPFPDILDLFLTG